MRWSDDIDLYCERLTPGLWGEPLNTLSNVAFLLAALAVWLSLRRHRLTGGAPDLLALPWLIAAIGVSSFVFHLLGKAWAAGLDSGFIALYMLSFAAIWAHRVGHMPWRQAWMGAPAFAAFSALTTLGLAQLSWAWLPASVALYVSAWLAIAVLWMLTTSHEPRGAPWLLATLGLFGLSLLCRQIDQPLCPSWPLGTHFGWHILNGLNLYCSAQALIAVAGPRSLFSRMPA